MTMKIAIFASAAVIALAAGLGAAAARDQVQVAGSSTVLPYAKIVAESFGEAFPDFKTPVVESGGSGAGIKQFCEGVGEDKIDIANSSRPMKAEELETCKTNGVADVEEVKIGYDGIVFATDIAGPDFAIQPVDIYKALAAQVVVDGKLVDNPYTKWNEVNAAFPEWDIAAYIPGEKHGTREVFETKLLDAGCDKDALKAAGVADDAVAKACIGISEKDFDDQMIGSDLKAKVAVPHSRLFAFDKSTNSQVDVDDLDLITNRYGDNLRLVESNSGNVREIFPTFLVL